MSFYRVCPRCGAHLDPGELCDCKKNTAPVLAHEDGRNETTQNDSAFILAGKGGIVNGSI